MHFDILTLFPEMFTGPLSVSIIGKARERGLLSVDIWNIRDYAQNKHKTVDDTPYGGGAGMVLRPDVLVRAIEAVRGDSRTPVIYLSPQGRVFNQELAAELATMPRLILLSGHYEEIDERVREKWVDWELSIGDYVLTGGELPAMVVVDAVARLLPGVLGDESSSQTDSFQDGLLDYPQYTRPASFRNMEVPEVLLSGHHEKIRRFRLKEALRRTLLRRPDLLERRTLSKEERQLLEELVQEHSCEGRVNTNEPN
ncbi:MAG TPA: tRNA (guanosine(37)-N1)-methyltransferase TrmD [Firmicutes bacterium]|jgi:tRNA (guanine37-N1)-methyltransferase|nr:tRNA (guanosine(37)-N1)-methyltransferase TrmD [Bacillota bacterium]HHT41978.1 tRNA (guanosine(37)-N1)-methyltransferase TrmD [Bacillota bacterium]